jgi:hypothetical protein
MRRILGCLAVIAFADYVILRHPPRWHAVALFDHPAHVATAILLGGRRLGTDPFYLAGSLLPDLDHIPAALGNPELGDPRPNTHSILVLGATALVSRRVAAGVAAHFVRDLALDPGVPLLWPFTGRQLRLPYAAYAALLTALAASRLRWDLAAR